MISKDYITAGNAAFTIELPARIAVEWGTPYHYTYRVRHKRGSGQYGDTWFVSLLTGPDNEHSYTYIGVLHVKHGQVVLTKASKLTKDSPPVVLLNKVLARVWTDEGHIIEQHGFAVHHEGRCGRCGRLLTVPESIESGIGPECARKMGCERMAKEIRESVGV